MGATKPLGCLDDADRVWKAVAAERKIGRGLEVGRALEEVLADRASNRDVLKLAIVSFYGLRKQKLKFSSRCIPELLFSFLSSC